MLFCEKYYCLLGEGVDADESRKKCNRKQGLGRASKGEQTRIKSFELHSIDSSREILCLPYHIVMGIFGLKLLAPLHWKSFKDVKVLFILPNWIDIDHFWTHSTVFENYYAIFFFPLFVYLLYQVLTKKKILFVKKVRIRFMLYVTADVILSPYRFFA